MNRFWEFLPLRWHNFCKVLSWYINWFWICVLERTKISFALTTPTLSLTEGLITHSNKLYWDIKRIPRFNMWPNFDALCYPLLNIVNANTNTNIVCSYCVPMRRIAAFPWQSANALNRTQVQTYTRTHS